MEFLFEMIAHAIIYLLKIIIFSPAWMAL